MSAVVTATVIIRHAISARSFTRTIRAVLDPGHPHCLLGRTTLRVHIGIFEPAADADWPLAISAFPAWLRGDTRLPTFSSSRSNQDFKQARRDYVIGEYQIKKSFSVNLL